ncbi:hypothetical protein ABW636_02280 [Aquimarina sp. 2201CG1-2-11]|uniref:hypothetical protein n=1 Tax=Aquimarina discodermiae TaxID=3231043 RepID=UPI0034635199
MNFSKKLVSTFILLASLLLFLSCEKNEEYLHQEETLSENTSNVIEAKASRQSFFFLAFNSNRVSSIRNYIKTLKTYAKQEGGTALLGTISNDTDKQLLLGHEYFNNGRGRVNLSANLTIVYLAINTSTSKNDILWLNDANNTNFMDIITSMRKSEKGNTKVKTGGDLYPNFDSFGAYELEDINSDINFLPNIKETYNVKDYVIHVDNSMNGDKTDIFETKVVISKK